MCLLCSGKSLPQNIDILNCSNCLTLTSLPENLPESLHELYCYNCPNLTSLSENLPESLQELYCHNCPNLTSLPENLPEGLQILNCSYCPKLTTLPENCHVSTFFSGCPWLSQNSKYYPDNLPKLLVCQRAVRNRLLRKFVKLTSSRSFNEYFFHPERKGGIWAKKGLERQFS